MSIQKIGKTTEIILNGYQIQKTGQKSIYTKYYDFLQKKCFLKSYLNSGL